MKDKTKQCYDKDTEERKKQQQQQQGNDAKLKTERKMAKSETRSKGRAENGKTDEGGREEACVGGGGGQGEEERREDRGRGGRRRNESGGGGRERGKGRNKKVKQGSERGGR